MMTELHKKIIESVWDYPPHGIVERSMRLLMAQAAVAKHGKFCMRCKANLVQGHHLRGCDQDDSALIERCVASMMSKMQTT